MRKNPIKKLEEIRNLAEHSVYIKKEQDGICTSYWHDTEEVECAMEQLLAEWLGLTDVCEHIQKASFNNLHLGRIKLCLHCGEVVK